MRFLVNNEPLIHYRQVRPMVTRIYTEQQLADLFKAKHTISMDCSEAVTLLCRLAGLAPPFVYSYSSGAGNTQSMLDHLPHYSNAKGASVGAITIYGPPGHPERQHAGMVFERGADPLVFSHGKESDPRFVRHSIEVAAHSGIGTFLNVKEL